MWYLTWVLLASRTFSQETRFSSSNLPFGCLIMARVNLGGKCWSGWKNRSKFVSPHVLAIVCKYPTVVAGLSLQIWFLTWYCTILLISFFPVGLLKSPAKLYKALRCKTVASGHMLVSEPDTWCGRHHLAAHSVTRSSHETGCNGQGLRKLKEAH